MSLFSAFTDKLIDPLFLSLLADIWTAIVLRPADPEFSFRFCRNSSYIQYDLIITHPEPAIPQIWTLPAKDEPEVVQWPGPGHPEVPVVDWVLGDDPSALPPTEPEVIVTPETTQKPPENPPELPVKKGPKSPRKPPKAVEVETQPLPAGPWARIERFDDTQEVGRLPPELRSSHRAQAQVDGKKRKDEKRPRANPRQASPPKKEVEETKPLPQKSSVWDKVGK
jgi:hypothetical protein